MKQNPFISPNISLLSIALLGSVKYVNTNMNGQIISETYAIPKANDQIPKYLEIIYDENDDKQPVNPYETPLPPLENETPQQWHNSTDVQSSSKISFNSDLSNSDNNINITKDSDTSNSSTVNETNHSLVPTNVILTLPNSKEDCTSNEKLLMSQQPSIHSHDINNKKLQQFYVNTNIENAILNCDGITSM